MDSFQPVCLPVVLGDDEPLELRLWEQGAPLYEAGFGTLAPSELSPQVEPDIVVMPLLGFDKHGTRLGYGGGYYDRTLARLRAMKPVTAIGLAYTGQEMDEVPRGPHDQRLDWVLTDSGYVQFQSGFRSP